MMQVCTACAQCLHVRPQVLVLALLLRAHRRPHTHAAALWRALLSPCARLLAPVPSLHQSSAWAPPPPLITVLNARPTQRTPACKFAANASTNSSRQPHVLFSYPAAKQYENNCPILQLCYRSVARHDRLLSQCPDDARATDAGAYPSVLVPLMSCRARARCPRRPPAQRAVLPSPTGTIGHRPRQLQSVMAGLRLQFCLLMPCAMEPNDRNSHRLVSQSFTNVLTYK